MADLLDDVFFILVPEENVDARMFYTRGSASGINLNRDNNYQITPETQNMQHLIGTYDPVTLLELHGIVIQFQVEPSTPPHNSNYEYDIITRQQVAAAEAFGAAAVANNPSYQSYMMEQRDLMLVGEDDTPYWERGGDNYPLIYTPTYAMLHGYVGYTVELPAFSEDTRTAGTYGLLGLADYVAANKDKYFANLAEIYSRGIENKNSDTEVSPWYVDANDNIGAEAEIFRPAHTGEGENGQFFPECYLIPLDAENQTNLQAAYEMIEYLTRNDVKVRIADSPVTADGKTLPAGTAIVSMYQAKRSVANAVLYNGLVISGWDDMINEAAGAYSHIRGFDMVTCVKPAEYEAIKDALGETITYDTLQPFFEKNAVSRFIGEEGGDVIISNTSEASAAAVNALLRGGKQVAMITEGEYKGDFICSYDDWKSVSADYILTGTGVKNPEFAASVIGKSPIVYITGTEEAFTPEPSGFIYDTLVTIAIYYNYDRIALERMGFAATEDAAKADAVVGTSGLDQGGIAAVQAGVPYIACAEEATEIVQESLLPELETVRAFGVECLGYVIYPEETLTNASYITHGDDLFYGTGMFCFTELPENAKVLVQWDGSRAPLEGHFNEYSRNKDAFLNGIMGFSYTGPDKDGNNVNITLFANTLTGQSYQRDEFGFISNALFANALTDTPYAPTAAGGNQEE